MLVQVGLGAYPTGFSPCFRVSPHIYWTKTRRGLFDVKQESSRQFLRGRRKLSELELLCFGRNC